MFFLSIAKSKFRKTAFSRIPGALILVTALLCLVAIRPSNTSQAFAPFNNWYHGFPSPNFTHSGRSHEAITEKAIKEVDKVEFGVTDLNNSMKKALEQIINANGHVDDFGGVTRFHFDGENFQQGQKHLQDQVQEIKKLLSTDQNLLDPSAARDKLGWALHTLQDFYSHSNWVETTSPGTVHPSLGAAGAGLQAVSLSTPTCNDNQDCRCTTNNCPNLLNLAGLTSGYFGGGDRSKPIPAKCNHGGIGDSAAPTQYILDSSGNVVESIKPGINKDTRSCLISPHSNLHDDAANRAITATEKYIREVVKPQLTTKQFAALLGHNPQMAMVVDTTISMAPHIAAVKQRIAQIVNSKRNTIHEPVFYTLVPFNDPFNKSGVVTTTDADVFLNAVNGLTAQGGGDCPEPVLSAMLHALLTLSSFGNLYLFSDAEASDGYFLREVLFTAGRRQVKIFEMLNYGCGSTGTSRAILPAATGGRQLRLTGSDIGGGMDLMDHTLRTDMVDLLSIEESLSNTTKSYTVPVDSTINGITFSLASVSSPSSTVINSFTVTRPDGSTVQETDSGVTVTNFNTGRFVSISSPVSGMWTVSVNASATISLRVYGQSNLDITSMSFVELRGNSAHPGWGPISGPPVMGQVGKMLARLGTQASSVNFELRSTRGTLIQSFSLSELTETGGVNRQFIGDVTVPQMRFLVYVVGTDVSGVPFQRIWPGVFDPQPLLKVREDTSNSCPVRRRR